MKKYHLDASFETLEQAENSLKEKKLWSKVETRPKIILSYLEE